MTSSRLAHRVTTELFDLAEGVLWDDHASLVRWVDIRLGRLLAGHLVDDRIEIVQDAAFGQTISAVALAADGGLLLAGAHGFCAVSPAGEVTHGPDIHSASSEWRLNDGIVDPQGRFVIGTLSLDDDRHEATEVLLRVSPNGLIETLRTGLGMSNGLGFSPDGATIFHIDTLAGTLSSHSYSSGPFDDSEPWHTIVSDFAYFADGMTVDASGGLWVAQWGGARICHFAQDGTHIDDLEVNATQPTCVGFVGPGLNRLAITSARKGLESPHAAAGALFLADVGERGLPENRWAGSTVQPYWIRH